MSFSFLNCLRREHIVDWWHVIMSHRKNLLSNNLIIFVFFFFRPKRLKKKDSRKKLNESGNSKTNWRLFGWMPIWAAVILMSRRKSLSKILMPSLLMKRSILQFKKCGKSSSRKVKTCARITTPDLGNQRRTRSTRKGLDLALSL